MNLFRCGGGGTPTYEVIATATGVYNVSQYKLILVSCGCWGVDNGISGSYLCEVKIGGTSVFRMNKSHGSSASRVLVGDFQTYEIVNNGDITEIDLTSKRTGGDMGGSCKVIGIK